MEDLSYILSRVILYINHLYIISSLFMRIHVRFFASHKERIGCSNLLLELNEGSKIINLIDKETMSNQVIITADKIYQKMLLKMYALTLMEL